MIQTPVLCLYCKRMCRKVPGRKLDLMRHYWQCDYHGATVVKFAIPPMDSETWYNAILTVHFRDTIYDVVFLYDNPHSTSKFRIEKAPTDIARSEIIFSLDFHPPDITPENVQKKLPTYLLFS